MGINDTAPSILADIIVDIDDDYQPLPGSQWETRQETYEHETKLSEGVTLAPNNQLSDSDLTLISTDIIGDDPELMCSSIGVVRSFKIEKPDPEKCQRST